MADIIDESTSLLDSAIGPVAVTTTTYKGYNIDDYVRAAVVGRAELLRILNKARTINPLDVRNRPPVNIGDISLGGFDGV